MSRYDDFPPSDDRDGHSGPPPGKSIEQAFIEFDQKNPHVYERLVAMCVLAQERGVEKLGIGRLFEVLRWEHAVSTQGDEFKLNNNYRSYYSRKIMLEHPELEGFFDTRRLHA